MQKIIDEKDKLIRKLQFRLQKLQAQKQALIKAGKTSSGIDMVNFYKQKLSLEMHQNDRAFQLLLSINERIMKLTNLLRSVSQLQDQSSELKGLINIIGNASFNQSQNQLGNTDDPQNMEVAQNQLLNRLQQLQYVSDIFHKNFVVNKKQNSDLQKKCSDVKKDCADQLTLLSSQLNELRTQKESLRSLLEKNQKDKNHIVSKINNALDAKGKKQLQKMSREQLIQLIKRLMFKNSQLETGKSQAIKEIKKNKAQDLQKYKKILNDVKLCKEVSRLGRSMM